MKLSAASRARSGSGAASSGIGDEALAAPEVSETAHVPSAQHCLAHGAWALPYPFSNPPVDDFSWAIGQNVLSPSALDLHSR